MEFCSEHDAVKLLKELEGQAGSILVMDPGGQIRELLDLLLATIARQITYARNAAEGYALALTDRPDLIVAFNGPHEEGSKLCALVRGDPPIRHTPFLILTSSGNVKDYPAYLESGCDQILALPFRCREFFASIKAALTRALAESLDRTQVLFPSGRTGFVEKTELGHLIESKRILCFRRRDGLAIIGRDPVRSGAAPGYAGEERRVPPC